MSLFEFFFPEQAQANQLRRLVRAQNRSARTLTNRNGNVERRIDELEKDLGYVTLLLSSVLRKLDERGVVTRREVTEVMAQLDPLDGARDDALDVGVLRGLLAKD